MFFIPSSEDHQEVVNIYTWYGVIDEKITKQFTEETGIKVNIDFYDNNETLEARLLASNSGYDVVFPSASPYVALQKRAGVYLKLDHGTIPNIKYVSRDVKLQLKDIDKDLDYCVPYYWGTTGFMIDTKKLSTMPIFNGEASIKDIISYKSLKEAASFGVSFLEESIDVLPTVRLYLGIDPNSQSEKDLKPVMNFLQKIRPAIRRFATSRTVHDIVSKEIALAMTWSSYAHQAMDESEYVSKNYKYVLPKEGTLVWIDCMAIPKGAPNMRNAYKFINFMLRPKIAAKFTEYTTMATTINASKKYLSDAIKNDSTIFPPKHIMKKSFLNVPPVTREELVLDHKTNRQWTLIKQGEFKSW